MGGQEILIWTDDLKLDSGRTDSSVAWKLPLWQTWKVFLSTNTEVFDTEVYTIAEKLDLVERSERTRRTSILNSSHLY